MYESKFRDNNKLVKEIQKNQKVEVDMSSEEDFDAIQAK
jgi:hypothetical protein